MLIDNVFYPVHKHGDSNIHSWSFGKCALVAKWCYTNQKPFVPIFKYQRATWISLQYEIQKLKVNTVNTEAEPIYDVLFVLILNCRRCIPVCLGHQKQDQYESLHVEEFLR